MDTNKIVIEYPKGLDINLTFVDSTGKAVNSFAMTPPLLIRLNGKLEFQSAASGNILTLLGLSDPESDATDSDENEEDDDDNAMDQDTTVDLVTSEDDDATDDDDATEDSAGTEDDDATKDEDATEDEDDMVVIAHPRNP